MKVATYCRISTDEERQPFSLEAQTERLNAYIFSQEGWNLARTYTDQMSGKTLERSGLQQAIHEARSGRYELMLVYKVDRLARSVSGLAHILEELQSAGVGFRSASEPFDTSTAAGRMMVQMLGVFAEFEREMIVERTKMGLAKKASKGEWTGGKAPFGYGYDAERRLLIPAEDEAPIIKAIFDRYTGEGWGSMAIAKWLNEKCDLTRSGANWTPQRIISILRNPTYIGLLPFGGELYEASHERLVESDQFERAGALLQERGEAWALRRSNPSDYLLTSFLRCKKCNHGFIGTAAHGRSNTYRYYTCFSRQRHGTSKCDQDRLPADRLEERILSAILAELDDGSIFERAAELGRADWEAANSGRAGEISRLEKKINERRGALDRYLKAFEAGRLSEKTCAYRVKEVENELEVLGAEKSTLEAQDGPPAVKAGRLRTLRSEIERTISEGSPQDVKALLASCLDSIVVDSRKFVQPFYCLPAVRIVSSSRRIASTSARRDSAITPGGDPAKKGASRGGDRIDAPEALLSVGRRLQDLHRRPADGFERPRMLLDCPIRPGRVVVEPHPRARFSHRTLFSQHGEVHSGDRADRRRPSERLR